MGLFFIFHSYLMYLIVNGVFGDEVKSVSVMEGDSVTLHTDVIKQRDDLIVWYYGPENTVVAKINGEANSTKLSQDERLRGRLELKKQTGDLTISDVKTTDTGPYKLRISSNNKVSYKNFNIIVYTRLPVPVISRDSSEDPSSSKCVVLCSVMSVSHDVSVSWYKGKSLLSSISVSDLNIRLSLPLEVEYQDTNTYRCVVNNPITNLTQHLHITQLCHMSSESPDQRLIVITAVVVSMLCVIIIISISIIIYMKKRKVSGKSSESQNHLTEEKRSISSSSTCEEEESSKCLNDKQQHWIEAGSV